MAASRSEELDELVAHLSYQFSLLPTNASLREEFDGLVMRDVVLGDVRHRSVALGQRKDAALALVGHG